MPREIYRALKRTMRAGERLSLDVANVVASALKDWAVEKGATHYTHWFQPMTGITAEKHDSFIQPSGDGNAIMEFSGKELVRGEPDASSFPSGGLRATFEARGYTVWDTTSYAFIKDGVLCIPTAFCSFNGEALDKKTPLLRSMEALDRQAMRILRLFEGKAGRGAGHVIPMVGPEQEYFLVDKRLYLKRPDLIYTGRTLFGARPPKGQELDDHYFGNLKPRVSEFMKDLDEELWTLGVYAKTKHNETAPGQHELAITYGTANICTDHNQLTMELMKRVADRHDLACLLHEKPFAGVNGSGKHNNWSLATDTGLNLLEPGETPYENAQFLLFLVAVIKAIDKYPDLLRVSAASPGNDHRLGANEAPPAIISIFLGDELTDILEALEHQTDYRGAARPQMEIGVTVLPPFPKDTTDRNRTSPFAFTGNKFEFRMLGASSSIADPNIALNTMVADVLQGFADTLENAADFKTDLAALIRDTFHRHKRVVFNGNNYSDEWENMAKERGLPNRKTAVDAMPALVSKESLELFARHNVFTKTEIHSRYDILLESYCKTLHIEALTMVDLAKGFIIPASISYQAELVALYERKNKIFDTTLESHLIHALSKHSTALLASLNALENALAQANGGDLLTQAKFYRGTVFPAMAELRCVADELEALTAKKHWPLPSYAELLYSVV